MRLEEVRKSERGSQIWGLRIREFVVRIGGEARLISQCLDGRAYIMAKETGWCLYGTDGPLIDVT
jgi:hypothetical protein